MKTVTDLLLWQKAHQLVILIYKITKPFPQEEKFALTSQIRRAAISIPANISEGYKKKTLPNKLNFLNISEGSLEEVKYYLYLSKDLGYINDSTYNSTLKTAEEVGKILNGFENFLKNKKK